MSRVVEEHRGQSPQRIGCAIVTVSDTRTIATDRGGQLLVELLEQAGHVIHFREIVPDDPDRMKILLGQISQMADVQAILMTGGTGISKRDQTFETVSALLDKPLPGYGELFRMLSFQDIGAAAMLSRAIGGVFGRQILLTMPGSPAAVRLAVEQLILPELGHLVREAQR
jgi:molybdenum cofactor biosynthesis protein B